MPRKTEIDEIKEILKTQAGLDREEAREYIRNLRKEGKVLGA